MLGCLLATAMHASLSLAACSQCLLIFPFPRQPPAHVLCHSVSVTRHASYETTGLAEHEQQWGDAKGFNVM